MELNLSLGKRITSVVVKNAAENGTGDTVPLHNKEVDRLKGNKNLSSISI